MCALQVSIPWSLICTYCKGSGLTYEFSTASDLHIFWIKGMNMKVFLGLILAIFIAAITAPMAFARPAVAPVWEMPIQTVKDTTVKYSKKSYSKSKHATKKGWRKSKHGTKKGWYKTKHVFHKTKKKIY